MNEEEDSHDGVGIAEDRVKCDRTSLKIDIGMTVCRRSVRAEFANLFIAVHRSKASDGDRLRPNGLAGREIGGA